MQSEQQLENNLIKQLEGFGFGKVGVVDADGLEENLKVQLEKLNAESLKNKPFSKREFSTVLNELNKGGIFEKSKLLRDRINIVLDNGEEKYIQFFDKTNIKNNIFQVTNQITQNGKYENRYDVTILINGLPLVQIELKRRGVEMKEAFNQVGRYHKHSFSGTLFEFVQIFIISNGDEVKYFSNNPSQSYEQTFFWTDIKNKKISDLSDFAEIFLQKEFLGKYISEYIVLAESEKIPMVLRAYQYYAVKAIEERVQNTDKGGYIWHTTGSGKTLTSFKASQVLLDIPKIKKILFVVDRKDLDIQTTTEFNSFQKDSVDGSENTSSLVRQLSDPTKRLVVTTIQKLDRALAREQYLQKFKHLENENMVIIFDECHRGQFGDTNKRIKEFFKKSQIFGFTGTPIFADNANKGKTTKDIFGDSLHKYIITDAIADNNVLGFSAEYVGKYKNKNDFTVERDIEVEDIDTKEILESTKRVEKITEFILKDWKRKTKNGKFNAILAVSSVEMLKKYYLAFTKLKDEDFKVATIFSYQANEEDKDDGSLDVEEIVNIENQHSRDFLEKCISDYNADFGTNFSTQNFEGYRQNLQKRIKGEKKGYLKREDKRVDLVIVVNMLLTGFDARKLNTLYVDKNLKYHGLIQAFSRTNRLLNSDKPHGNIVIFRNLKKNSDEALALYGDPEANEVVFKKPYKIQVAEFNSILEAMREVAPEYVAVDNFKSEEEKAKFIKIFRELLRKKSSLETFSEFTFDDLNIFDQEFESYKGKYFELYENNKKNTDIEKESILDEIDFELELVLKEEINYDFIISLLGKIVSGGNGNRDENVKKVLKQIKNNLSLKSKRELIEKFINDNLPQLDKNADISFEFEKFWKVEREKYLKNIIEENNLDTEKFSSIISEYIDTEKMTRSEKILELFPENNQPNFLEENKTVSRIKSYIFNFREKFEWA